MARSLLGTLTRGPPLSPQRKPWQKGVFIEVADGGLDEFAKVTQAHGAGPADEGGAAWRMKAMRAATSGRW